MGTDSYSGRPPPPNAPMGMVFMLNVRRMPRASALAIAVLSVVLCLPAACPSAEETQVAPPDAVPRSEIDALIDGVGKTPPEWFDSVKLEYPRSLDLSWPERPPTMEWNNQKNVGQYVWDIINPNPSKWKSGIRFMHFLLEKNAGNVEVRTRVMQSLGQMYFDFFRDYPRAAFWWRAAKVDTEKTTQGVHLAECYWRMGNTQMAKELLGRLPNFYPAIKLWADMGQTDQALVVANAFAKSGYTDMAYLSAGDACRTAGKLDDALAYYGHVLTLPATGRMAKRIQFNQRRARANIAGIKLYDSLDLTKVPDGKYAAKELGYAGDIHVEVAVAGGRIESVKVTRHEEKQFYSAMEDMPSRIVEAQGFSGVDAVTGATITSDAILNAAAKALAKAAE